MAAITWDLLLLDWAVEAGGFFLPGAAAHRNERPPNAGLLIARLKEVVSR